jgi:molybdenum cofactor biosynthesis enzyme MoaA
MVFSTFSIVVGDMNCNARCPYCVAKMTPRNKISHCATDIDWINFKHACDLAKTNGVNSVLLTGKGEPTLFKGEIETYLKALEPYNFPFIDVQTNGIAIENGRKKDKAMYEHLPASELRLWRKLGLSFIALSIAHWDSDKNAEIYQPKATKEERNDLEALIAHIRSIGFSVRLSCTMNKGYIDSVDGLKSIIQFAKDNDVQQVTCRAVSKPLDTKSPKVTQWVEDHEISDETMGEMVRFIESEGNYLMTLPFGAPVYDIYGCNFCLANCLMIGKDKGDGIQMQFWPNGRIRYDWQMEGAILL